MVLATFLAYQLSNMTKPISERYQKMINTMIEKYGSIEAWKKHMSEIGSKGGKEAKDNKHFRTNPELASKAGLRSAEIRRNKNK
jgi:general stress protein YciG